MMDANETWQLDEHVRYRRLFDEAVLIHQQRSEALVLNDTGVAFLELCDGQSSVDEIIRVMATRYEVDAETLSIDLAPFIEELARDGIIHRVATGPA